MNAPQFLDNEGYGPVGPPPGEDYNFETQEGRDAFIAGRGLETNDYPPRSKRGGMNKSHQAWKAGWMQAARCRGAV